MDNLKYINIIWLSWTVRCPMGGLSTESLQQEVTFKVAYKHVNMKESARFHRIIAR